MVLLANKLKEKKLKVTPQRLAIYETVSSTDTHPSAEAIYNGVKDRYPTMSLATVYKTLASLKSKNLVREFNFGDGSYRYDANVDFHIHLICAGCGEVFDFWCPDSDFSFRKSVEEHANFEVLYEQTFFYGHCENCKTNKG